MPHVAEEFPRKAWMAACPVHDLVDGGHGLELGIVQTGRPALEKKAVMSCSRCIAAALSGEM